MPQTLSVCLTPLYLSLASADCQRSSLYCNKKQNPPTKQKLSSGHYIVQYQVSYYKLFDIQRFFKFFKIDLRLICLLFIFVCYASPIFCIIGYRGH